MIGYDFNGVIDTGKYWCGPTDVIITGNTIPLSEGVMTYLQQKGMKCAVYFQPDSRGAHNMIASAIWKSEMIRKLGITKFYEDDPVQFNIIKNSCFDCEVIKV